MADETYDLDLLEGSARRWREKPALRMIYGRIFAEMGAEGKRARTLREWAQYEYEQGNKERSESLRTEVRQITQRLETESETAHSDDERKS